VRNIVTPGSTNSLWKSVKAAIDLTVNNLKTTIFEKGVVVPKIK
jgi:hypothetical protein